MASRRRAGEGAGLDAGHAQTLAGRHLLLVPSTVDPAEVATLVRARYPRADLASGQARLGRHSALSGPWHLSMEDAVDAAVPMPWTVCYDLQAPVEREDPRPVGLSDRDGVSEAFPGGLPWRDEGRGIWLMASLARRLAGAVRVVGGHLITPDPTRAVDYSVHAPFWLEPQLLMNLVSPILPGASVLLPTGGGWSPPARTPAPPGVDPAQWEAFQARLDASDAAAVSGGSTLDGYAVTGHSPQFGTIEVGVRQGNPEEPALAGQPWAAAPFASYRMTWLPPDPVVREIARPHQGILAARAAAGQITTEIARRVVEATSGLVLDEDGFPLDRYRL